MPLIGAELYIPLLGGTTVIVDFESTFVTVIAFMDSPLIILLTETLYVYLVALLMFVVTLF